MKEEIFKYDVIFCMIVVVISVLLLDVIKGFIY